MSEIIRGTKSRGVRAVAAFAGGLLALGSTSACAEDVAENPFGTVTSEYYVGVKCESPEDFGKVIHAERAGDLGHSIVLLAGCIDANAEPVPVTNAREIDPQGGDEYNTVVKITSEHPPTTGVTLEEVRVGELNPETREKIAGNPDVGKDFDTTVAAIEVLDPAFNGATVTPTEWRNQLQTP